MRGRERGDPARSVGCGSKSSQLQNRNLKPIFPFSFSISSSLHGFTFACNAQVSFLSSAHARPVHSTCKSATPSKLAMSLLRVRSAVAPLSNDEGSVAEETTRRILTEEHDPEEKCGAGGDDETNHHHRLPSFISGVAKARDALIRLEDMEFKAVNLRWQIRKVRTREVPGGLTGALSRFAFRF